MKKFISILFILFFISIILYSDNVPIQNSEIKIQNLSYKEGASLISGIEGKDIENIKVKVTGIDVINNPVHIIFRLTAYPSKGDKIIITNPKIKVNNEGIAETSLKEIHKKGDYVLSAFIAEYPEVQPVNIKISIMSKGWYILVIVGLLGGLGVFLYGMKLCAEGLQNVAGDKMKEILSKFTKNTLSGYITGIIATGAVQSSSATTAMCVGFVGASLMTMAQAISVMQGARIGSTITAQLIAFKIADYALILVIAGFVMLISAHKKKFKQIGNVLIGFGFLFYGMEIMSGAMKPLRAYPDFTSMLLKLSSQPILAIICSIFFTAIIQSSAATVGLCIAFAEQNLITLESAVPLVLGAMVGTSATALLASLGANKNGKRTAIANSICALLAAIICTIFIKYIDDVVIAVTKFFGSTSVPRQVANTYTLCASFGVIVFFPFVNLIAKLIYKIIPETEDEKNVFAPQYIQEGFENNPDIALDMSKKELLRMGGIVQYMLNNIETVFTSKSEELIEKITKEDDKVDILDKAIRPYLNKISRSGNLSEEQSKLYITQLYLSSYFENIGDIVVKHLMHQANKLNEKNISLNEKEKEYIKNLSSKISELFKMVSNSFENKKIDEAESVSLLYTKLQRIAKKIHQEYFNSLSTDERTGVSESSIFLDAIEALMNIANTINSIAKVIVEEL